MKHWMPLLEDISSSQSFNDRMSCMRACLKDHDEWHYISIDATVKLCLKLKGQASYRASKAEREAAPFGDDTAWRRILTVRGRTGAVLMMRPVPSEKTEAVVEALTQEFSEDELNLIRYVATDSPSSKFYSELKAVCPQLLAISLDPIHLAIVYEYAQWHKKTPGSKLLRRVLSKTVAVDRRLRSDTWGDWYTGEISKPLSRHEEAAREHILKCSMPAGEARRLLDELDSSTPFVTRLHFFRCLAAICSLHHQEVFGKVTGSNKEVSKVLWSACAPDRVEWLFNHMRTRHAVDDAYVQLLPSGTSSNEALHAEINSWTRSLNVLHRSTLAVKLRYMMYLKLLVHHTAMFYPYTRVVCQSVILARSCQESIWTDAAWQEWCASQHSCSIRQDKAALPLASAREHEAALHKAWVKKRPASKALKSGARKRHRTPLNVPRIRSLAPKTAAASARG